MIKLLGVLGSALCLLAVAMGAYASHGSGLDAKATQSLEVAVRYQFWHGLMLVALSVLPLCRIRRIWAGTVMAIATIAFSGSIYLLVLAGLHAVWWVTPLGGTGLMLAWALVIWAYIRER
ncbi:DUF423 domain-containing protein [Echinimonas agarilytica]|uniref:DUF423 domain-containing protein n=1 Tax=Echinimonas agarilytica TaxID=1215918 RepID=A0AA42B6R8_9GAMM|nr:DUF423 domain-containing protein [Echinimonas agarilytica]MCM2679102.1 DUF423 domain-containing protein [Echinimonas agarilytica]